jgi:hypothetical protein
MLALCLDAQGADAARGAPLPMETSSALSASD